MSDDFSRQLDALMAQARADFQSEHSAMVEIARLLERHSKSKSELLYIGQVLASMRQPLPAQQQGPHQPQPVSAEQAEDAEWWSRIQQQRQQGQG